MTTRPSPIEAARERHRLADVAARTGIGLAAAHGTLTVRCPMPAHGHPDRTPSLRLYLDDETWYCFACSGRAGDVVEWVGQTERVDWRRAIQILDSGRPLTNTWAGIDDDRRRPTLAGPSDLPHLGRTSPGRIQETLDAAWEHCTAGPLHARAVAYLTGRKIDVTILEAYTGRTEAGHTPRFGPTLAQRLLSDGFTVEELVDAGLVHRYPDGRITDFYRDRVLVPLRDRVGQVAGLVGRNVGDPRWPKYKNPPRTALYDKSINLYQPLAAPASSRGRVIVVEGTLDAVAIAAAAVTTNAAHHVCPVTQSGRELSARQLATALRLHPGPLVISFDGDAAGKESSVRLARAVVQRGRAVRVVSLPDGADPASLLAGRGPRALGTWLPDDDAYVTPRTAVGSLRPTPADEGLGL